jgi:hypothetical protein
VAPREVEEGLVELPMLGVRGEDTAHFSRQVGESDGGKELAREALVLCAAADENLVALFAGDFDAKQADVADVVLRAGVMAAGDVEVDGLVDLEMAVEHVGQSDGVGFGVCGREAAALIASTGDGTAEDCAGFVVETASVTFCFTASTCSVAILGISRFCRTVRRSSPVPNRSAISAMARICSTGRRPTGMETPM